MKLSSICFFSLSLMAALHATANAQTRRGVAQTPPGAAPAPPPPPGPPPDFIDDDTEFDDGDDLPDNYVPPGARAGVPPPMPGNTGNPGIPPQIPGQQNHQVPFPNANAAPPPVTPPPPAPVPSYENDRPRFNGSKLHFKVVKDEFFEKGKKRERGKIEQN